MVRFPLIMVREHKKPGDYVTRVQFDSANERCRRWDYGGVELDRGAGYSDIFVKQLVEYYGWRIENTEEEMFLRALRREIYLQNRELRNALLP